MSFSSLYVYLTSDRKGKNLFHQIFIMSLVYFIVTSINSVIIGAFIKVIYNVFLYGGIHSIIFIILSLIVIVVFIIKKRLLNLTMPLLILLVLASIISISIALKYRNIAEDSFMNNMDSILNTYQFYQDYVSDYGVLYKNELGEKIQIYWECTGKKHRITSLDMQFASNSPSMYNIASKIYPDVNVEQYKYEVDNIIAKGDYSYKNITKNEKQENYTNVVERRKLSLIVDEDNYLFDAGYKILLSISGNIEQ